MCFVFQRTAFVVASLLACAAWGQSPPVEVEPPPVSVPSPGEVLGDVEAPRSAEIHGYLRRLAEASPRVYVETLGATEEGRELLLVAVSSEAHLADLDRLANISRALADPRATPREEAELLAQGAKALVYLLGAVPPGEAATPRALTELAHRLATADDPDLAEIREQAVVLITPVADPDGYDRTVDWRRTNPGVEVPPPWRGYYASPASLTDDPALVLPGLQAAAEVVRRFRPQQVRTAAGDVSSLLRGLAGVVRVGSELFRGVYARAEASLARGRNEPPFAWIFPPDPSGPVPRAELAELLIRYGVEVHRLQGELVPGERLFPEGSLLVRSDQPARDLALALLEGRRPPDGGAGSPFLGEPKDLPVLLGARGIAVDDVAVLDVPVAGRDWPPPEEEGRRRRRREPPPEPPALLEPVLEVNRPEGRVDGFGDGVFLVRDVGQRPLLTARVLLADHQVDAADHAFESGGREYPAGTLLVYAPRETVETAARETGLVFDAPLSTPDVPRHVVDLPRLGILHTWTDTASAGWLRLAFDRARVSYRFVSPEDLRRGDLRRRFDVLLWPDAGGGFRELVHGLDRDLGPLPYRRTDDAPSLGLPSASDDVTGGMGFVGLGELERFVRKGGALAVFGDTARPFVDGGLLRDVGRLRSALETGGAELRAGVTRPGHPLGYGLAPRDAFFVTSGPVWETRKGARDLAVLRFGDPGAVGALDTRERPTRPARPEATGVFEEDLPLETPEDEDETAGETEMDVEIVEEAPEQGTGEAPPASWKQAGPVVLSGDPAAGAVLDGRPAVLDVPLGEGRLVVFAFDPFPHYLSRSDLRPVWNLLLHWNDMP